MIKRLAAQESWMSAPDVISPPMATGTATIHSMKKQRIIRQSALFSFATWMMLVGLVSPASAARVNDLYQALVPVANQSEAARKTGVRRGLAQVLVKVSGSSGVLRQAVAIDALDRAESYVSELGYSQIGESQLALTIRYSQQQVNGLFSRESMPIWPADRPELLVWLVMDTPEEGRQHLDDDSYPTANSQLAYQLNRRGAAYIRPSLDIEDRRTVSADAVWQFDTGRLNAAAKRYGVKQWLAIRVYRSSAGQWRGASYLSTRGQKDLQQLVGDSMNQLLATAVDRAIDRLAADYVFVPKANADQLRLTLEDIASFDDYRNAVDYLVSLELVRDVQVIEVNDDQLQLALSMVGDSQMLLSTLRRDPHLREVSSSPGAAPASNPAEAAPAYRFRWVR